MLLTNYIWRNNPHLKENERRTTMRRITTYNYNLDGKQVYDPDNGCVYSLGEYNYINKWYPAYNLDTDEDFYLTLGDLIGMYIVL